MCVPGRVLRHNVVLRDDGKRFGLHPRGQAWKQADGGTMGGRRDVRRKVERREDGGMTGDSRRRGTADDGRQRTMDDSG